MTGAGRFGAGLVIAAVAAGCAGSGAVAEDNAEGELAILVEGNDEVSASELLAEARRELATWRSKRRKADAADAAYSMTALLRSEGFPDAEVAFEVTGTGLRFTVAEGPRAELGQVRFDIDDEFDGEVLASFFAFSGAGAFGSGRPLFVRGRVEAAVAELERWLLLQGYLEVRLEPPEYTFREGRTRVDVLVSGDPGRRFTVAGVEWEGFDPAEFGIEFGDGWIGKPFHARVPVELAARVRGVLLRAGHQFQEVRGEARIDREAALATLVVKGEPGPVVRLDGVRFRGLDRTRPWFARRRIPIDPGEALFQDMLDEGLNELYRTQLFGAVRAALVPTEGDLADLEVEVDELDARSLSTFLGYGSYEQVILNPRYRNENLFGIGRRFELGVRGSLKSQGIETRIEDPWIFGRRNTIETSASYELREEPSFDVERLEFGLGWRHRFAGPYRLRLSYDFRAQEADNITGDILDAEEEGFIRTAGIDFSIRRDVRDSALLPTRGSIVEIGSFWSSPGLGADLDFLELRLSAAQHVPLGERGVLAFGFRFDSREILDDRETLPIQERLFLGGESTVRAFGRDELGPVSDDGDPAGGLTSFTTTLEYRHRLWQGLHGAVFYDVGTVDPRAWTFSSEWGHAAGLGLRYYLPVGPIRVDVGYNPLERFAASRSWALHLAFGFTF